MSDAGPTTSAPRAVETSTIVLCLVIFVCAGSFIGVSDLWSKQAVFEFLEVETKYDRLERPAVTSQKRYDVFESWFQLEANYNYGAFSGWFSGRTGLLAVVSLIALIVIAAIALWHVFRSPQPEWMFVLALGLLWGGTLGNLYDRWKLAGVRDWIKWYVVIDGKEHVWPNFNIADAAICTGVGLIILRELLTYLRQRREERAAEDAPR